MTFLDEKNRILPMENIHDQTSVVEQPPRRRRGCNSMNIREIIRLIAQIFIPLMIGIFTIVLALQQQILSKENRENDFSIAKKHREQEYEIDEQHRKQEFLLDETRRFQDLSIAETNHYDSVFNIYIRDLTNILLKNNFTLNRPLLDSVIRPMTLTILRQLDSSRKLLLIKFLYESKMLQTNFDETRIDLADADLNHIQFGQICLHNLSLVGSSLKNSTFTRTDLTFADFRNADLSNSKFVNVTLTKVSFHRTNLRHVNFFQSNFFLTDLSNANLQQSTITNIQFEQSSSLNQAILPNGDQATSQNLISKQDQCSLTNWMIYPKRQINLTDKCHFQALKTNVTMRYNISLVKYQRLIQRQHAFIEVYFQALRNRQKSLDIHFLFFNHQNQIDRRSAITIYEVSRSEYDGFFAYMISSTYPSTALFLQLEIFFHSQDEYRNFEVFLEHIVHPSS